LTCTATTRAASAGSRTPAEEAAAAASEAAAAAAARYGSASGSDGGTDDANARIGGPGNRVRFAARGGKGVRGPLFEGSAEVGQCTSNAVGP
jgi:hypothetical protein